MYRALFARRWLNPRVGGSCLADEDFVGRAVTKLMCAFVEQYARAVLVRWSGAQSCLHEATVEEERLAPGHEAEETTPSGLHEADEATVEEELAKFYENMRDRPGRSTDLSAEERMELGPRDRHALASEGPARAEGWRPPPLEGPGVAWWCLRRGQAVGQQRWPLEGVLHAAGSLRQPRTNPPWWQSQGPKGPGEGRQQRPGQLERVGGQRSLIRGSGRSSASFDMAGGRKKEK